MAGRNDPLVRDLGRGPGQSQNRWAHLLGDGSEPEPVAHIETDSAPAGPTLAQRVAALEARIATLEEALGLEPEATLPPELSAP